MADVRRFTIDLAPDDDYPPMPGDIVRTARTVNRVTSCRPVQSRVWANRWALTVERLDAVPAAGARPLSVRVFHTRSYGRGERPEDVYGPDVAGSAA